MDTTGARPPGAPCSTSTPRRETVTGRLGMSGTAPEDRRRALRRLAKLRPLQHQEFQDSVRQLADGLEELIGMFHTNTVAIASATLRDLRAEAGKHADAVFKFEVLRAVLDPSGKKARAAEKRLTTAASKRIRVLRAQKRDALRVLDEQLGNLAVQFTSNADRNRAAGVVLVGALREISTKIVPIARARAVVRIGLRALETVAKLRQPSHSEDFSTAHWFGTDYVFTNAQAAVVRLLWSEWERNRGGLKEETIGDKIRGDDLAKYRLRDTFKQRRGMHPAWKTMIHSLGKGRFGLRAPDSQEHPK